MLSEINLTSRSSDWHRLHPSSLVFNIAGLIKRLIIPGIIVLFASRGGRWEIWLMVLFVPALLFSLFRFFTLRYCFAADELIVRVGWIFRNERHVPYRRIQNIDLVQNLFHRALNVAEVKIQTASGKEPEATLKVLSLSAVDSMRERIFGEKGRSGAESPVHAVEVGAHEHSAQAAMSAVEPEPAVTLAHLNAGELVRLGLISGRGLAMVAVLIGLALETNILNDVDIVENTWNWVWTSDSIAVTALGIIGLLSTIPVLMALSVAWALVRMYGFTLERRGEDLRISCGLFTRRNATVPRRRIQLISVRETILHRWMNRVAVRIETAAGSHQEGGDGHDAAISQKWFVPILPKQELAGLLAEVLPDLELFDVETRGLAPRAGRRMLARNLILSLLFSGVVMALWRPWGFASPLILVPWFAWLARAELKRTNYARTSRAIIYQSGVLTRRRSAALIEKIQVVAVTASPFDRRHRMATLQVDTAGAGPADHRIHIRYLPVEIARAIGAELFTAANRRQLHW